MEIYVWAISTVDTDVLHQAISIHSTDSVQTVLEQFIQIKQTLWQQTQNLELHFEANDPAVNGLSPHIPSMQTHYNGAT